MPRNGVMAKELPVRKIPKIPRKIYIKPEKLSKSAVDMINYISDPNTYFIPSQKRFYYKSPEDGTAKAVPRGIHTFLRNRFWPSYSPPSRASRNAYHKKKPNRVGVAGTKWENILSHAKDTTKSGIDLGLRVHGQIQDYVNMTEEEFELNNPLINAHALKFINALKVWKLCCLGAEVCIYNPKQRWGTAIDLVCADMEGQLVLIELKTGYQDYFKLSTQPLKKPLDSFACSPLNQARLQILMAQLTLKYEYNIKNARSLVVHITDSKVIPYYVLDQMYSVCPQLYPMLSYEVQMKNSFSTKFKKRKNANNENLEFKTFKQAKYIMQRSRNAHIKNQRMREKVKNHRRR